MSTARPLPEPGRPQHTLGREEDSTGPGGGCRNGVRPFQGTSAIQPRPLVTTPRREDAPCHGSVGRLQNHNPARRPDRARPTPDRPRPLPLGTSRAPPLPHPAGSPALDTHRASPTPLNPASRQPPSTPSSRASSSLLPAPDDAGPLDAPLGRELAAAPRRANPSPARSTRAHVRPRRASGRAASERTPAPCLLRRGPPRQDPRRADRKARGRTPVLTALAAYCPEGSLGTGSACPLPPAMKPVPPDPKSESARLPSLRTRLTGTPRAHTGVSDAGRSAARHCSPQRPPRPAMSHGVGTSGVDKHEGLWAAHPCGSLPGRPQATTCDPRVPREPGSPARDAYVQQGCHLHSGRLSKVTAQQLVPRAGHG
nr:translation initiation factor IF-2-like isoform X2 [Manis javanica]